MKARRIFDVLVTIIVAIALTPVLLVSVFLLRCTLGSPVFFRQTRPGRDGLAFDLVKFRLYA